ncbi:MAG: hypothetical protein Solumvirus4_22 [Solumvirus sp.]|uniref:Glycosyltransferase 2-like domain-containing protein n=1 Tax=Solumvirus sp. TaxID=2487773 RepID=A0A3G5AIA8_9VIRU|nr:MAG: hypothetical protein Solumvirus4_22 [Solumvirus sp.]
MTKITCELLGGLGNQLFQIATVLATAWKYGLTPVFLDRKPYVWEHAVAKSYWDTVFHKVKLVTSTNGYPEHKELHDHRYREIPRPLNNLKIHGYFQAAQYFHDYRPHILKMFELPNNYRKCIAQQIRDYGETLAVHVRRGDYAQAQALLPLEYYIKALSKFPSSLTVIIFSDDKQWCKNNIGDYIERFDKVIYSNQPDYIELYMIAECNHRIIANSSFSWWGAYLSDYSGRTVIPPTWMVKDGKEVCPDIQLPSIDPNYKYKTPILDSSTPTQLIVSSTYLGSQSEKIFYPIYLRKPVLTIKTVILASNPERTGRLGNKMFQFSHLMALKYDLHERLQINSDLWFDSQDYDFIYSKDNIKNHSFNSISTKLKFWEQPSSAYHSISDEVLSKGLIVNGYVQSHKYFGKYSSDIINYWYNLQLKATRVSDGLPFNIRLLDDIITKIRGKSRNIVGIHVRRGDYLNLPQHPVIPKEYYNAAIDLMKERFSYLRGGTISGGINPVTFLFFSDDHNWVMSEKWSMDYSIFDVKRYFSGSQATLDYIEMLAMSKCDAFIIANSAFSWWSAFLSRSKDVAYPHPWFGAQLSGLDTSDLVPDEWTPIRWDIKPNIKDLGKFLRDEKDTKIVKDCTYHDEHSILAWRCRRYAGGFESLKSLITFNGAEYTIRHIKRLIYNTNNYSYKISRQLQGLITPKVSVIIPSYQRYELVRRAIESVLSQTLTNIEVIVVNDASPDKRYLSLDIDYPGVKFIHNQENNKKKYQTIVPQGITRMQGVSISRGTYIAFLDDDDYYCLPNKLEVQLNMLETYKVSLLCSNMICNDTLQPYHSKLPLGKSMKFNQKEGEELLLIDSTSIKDTNYICTSTVLVDRESLIKSGGQKAERYEDYRSWQRMFAMGCKGIFHNIATVMYDTNHGGEKHYSYQ